MPGPISNGPAGTYTFRITVSVPPQGLPADYRIIGAWASDNETRDVLINGVSTGISSTGGATFSALSPFPAKAGLGLFHFGDNTVEFKVENDQVAGGTSPLGLRVEAGVTVMKFRRGDSDDDGHVDLTDAIFTLNCMFLGFPCPTCADAWDANDDGAVDITDPIDTINWLFNGGGQLPAPGPFNCGPDPSADTLDCLNYLSRC
jgi:hypothetical protein